MKSGAQFELVATSGKAAIPALVAAIRAGDK
jgi:hypothetical protein